jgi:TrmH family RNA methyltransferase
MALKRMEFWKDNISFVLVEPREPGNIGASARAMKNMGFRNLELVKSADHLAEEARQMACQGTDVLENAKIYSNLGAAIRDKQCVVGTTRRSGRTRGMIVPVKESIRKIIAAAGKNKIAILFGRERNGLTNHEVERCGFLITIPSDPSSPSLNLAQSVLLVAYELSQKTYKPASPEFVTHEALEDLYRHMQATLKLLEYAPRGDSDLDHTIMRNLKHLIGRAGLTEWEVKMIHGLCTQVERKINRR